MASPPPMLAIISDVHLLDGSCHAEPSRLHDLVRALRGVRDFAKERGVARFDLVCIGDILDLLRSEGWADQGISAAKLHRYDEKVAFVADLLRGIVRNPDNHILFACLRELRAGPAREPRLGVVKLVPGNHDRLLAELPGHFDEPLNEIFGAHEILTEELARFEDHGVLATHGNQWDPWNRTWHDRQARPCPYGDFIVLDLVNRFPREVAATLDLPLADPVVREYQRIEHVPPERIPVWIEYCLQKESPALREPTRDAWRRSLAAFRQGETVWDRVRSPSYYLDKTHVARNERRDFGRLAAGLRQLHLAARSPVYMLLRRGSFVGRMLNWWLRRTVQREDRELLLRAAHVLGVETSAAGRRATYRWLVSGHTHRRMREPVQTTAGTDGEYVNTGAWRDHLDLDPRTPSRWRSTFHGAVAMFWHDRDTGAVQHQMLDVSSEKSEAP